MAALAGGAQFSAGGSRGTRGGGRIRQTAPRPAAGRARTPRRTPLPSEVTGGRGAGKTAPAAGSGAGGGEFQVRNGRNGLHVIPYVGNKSGFRHIFDELIPDSVSGRRVYDVFGGGASFSIYACIRFGSRNVTYNDNNPVVVNLIRHVRDDPGGLFREYEAHRGKSSPEHYLDVRQTDLEDGLAGAGRFLYLAKNAFSGKIRFNRSNRFNSPMRKSARCPALGLEPLSRISSAIRGMSVTNEPYQRYAGTRDGFVYLDPPYLGNANGHYNGVPDTAEFIGFVKGIEGRNMVMISEQNDRERLELSDGYTVYPVRLNRSLQYVTQSGSSEIVAINYPPPPRRRRGGRPGGAAGDP